MAMDDTLCWGLLFSSHGVGWGFYRRFWKEMIDRARRTTHRIGITAMEG